LRKDRRNQVILTPEKSVPFFWPRLTVDTDRKGKKYEKELNDLLREEFSEMYQLKLVSM
jgi:hypothetical protein